MCTEDKRVINTKYFESKQEIFDTAGQLAITESKTLGLPITYVVNNEIIKEYPDGKKEFLGVVPPKIKVKEMVISLN
ncbi:MAG: hypothetical protein PF693_01040 [Spirochaetia bacterium]|jgi:hypothetical protein|nr:hypothetical protein [Spirochaetia bacterium]